MGLAIILVPLLMAAAAWSAPSPRWRAWMIPAASLAHRMLVLAALREEEVVFLGGWFVLDPLGRIVLLVLSVLHVGLSLYAPGYLALQKARDTRLFAACFLVFLGTTSMMVMARHLGLMWVALETTTIATGPLIYFHRTPSSLEAVWKYLLIGSVGIALALLGSFFLAYSALVPGLESTLFFDDLVRLAPELSKPWLHAAFAILFIGYGTKMGLSPMHTWKPDAYGEAPGIVGALLAGGTTSCAFLAILRFVKIARAAGDAQFVSSILIFFGLLSMAFAAVFVIRQRDFKRLLAWSSVEHMGILVLGIGIGGLAAFGALLHLLNNAVAKCVLFLSCGNIQRCFGSKTTDDVRGALVRTPFSAAFLIAGLFAVTGSPPFGPFVSEFTILRTAFANGHLAVPILFLVLLFIVFNGMAGTILGMVQGQPPDSPAPSRGENFAVVAPIVLFLGLTLLLGLFIPPPLEALLREGAAFLEAGP
ncbi:hydrogenase [Candidatus Poribacteria bacterium]|nr:hydrogenase [Candidatus Poribacteria bacterium]